MIDIWFFPQLIEGNWWCQQPKLTCCLKNNWWPINFLSLPVALIFCPWKTISRHFFISFWDKKWLGNDPDDDDHQKNPICIHLEQKIHSEISFQFKPQQNSICQKVVIVIFYALIILHYWKFFLVWLIF